MTRQYRLAALTFIALLVLAPLPAYAISCGEIYGALASCYSLCTNGGTKDLGAGFQLDLTPNSCSSCDELASVVSPYCPVLQNRLKATNKELRRAINPAVLGSLLKLRGTKGDSSTPKRAGLTTMESQQAIIFQHQDSGAKQHRKRANAEHADAPRTNNLDRFQLGPTFVTGTDVQTSTSGRKGQATTKTNAGVTAATTTKATSATTTTRKSRTSSHPDSGLMNVPEQQIK